MIHRAPFGSMERFIAILIENTAGDFPLWLSPDQFIILPISEKYVDYAKKVSQLLENHDISGLIDDRNEKTGKKIRDARIEENSISCLVVGENEEQRRHSFCKKTWRRRFRCNEIRRFCFLFQKSIETGFEFKA